MQGVDQLARMNADELREFAASLLERLARKDGDIARLSDEGRLKQLRIDQLTHEIATLRRWKFAARSERLAGEQRTLFEETLEADIQAIELELDALRGEPAKATNKEQPKRAPLPASLPRREIRHEPESTRCACGCEMRRIGEDIAEKLDYVPGTFTVERHIRGKWACAACGVLTQAAVPAQVIDKGIPTAGLLAQVLVSKYADHAPLYRQEAMFERTGVAIARSTLGTWVGACGVRLQPLVDALRAAMLKCGVLHADETPVSMLVPGAGKTHRAYLWTYGTTQFDAMKAVVYDFAEGRAGRHAKDFLGQWHGTLVCDDYAGYKALFESGRIAEAGCMAHARRKFHELWANHKSETAHEALKLYDDGCARPGRDRSPMRCTRGSPCTARRPRTELRWPARSTTAQSAGLRSRGSSQTGRSRSTTTGSRTASGPWRWAARIGCSPARSGAASARPR
jgi:transposase